VKDLLEQLLTQAVRNLQINHVLSDVLQPGTTVNRSRNAAHGDYTSTLAMLLAPGLNLTSVDLAQRIVAALPSSDRVLKVEIAGPGFINFYLRSGELQAVVHTILRCGGRYGHNTVGAGLCVLVKFVAANGSVPLPVSHGRGVALCASLANLLRACGYEVLREYCVSDKRFVFNPVIRDEIRSEMAEFGVIFDTYVSACSPQVAAGADIDAVLHVLDADLHARIPGIRTTGEALGLEPRRLEYLLIQAAILSGSGESQQVPAGSSRWTTLRQFCADAGKDAARYFYVMRGSQQPLKFDLDLARSHNRRNPLYNVQYAHARICSVLRTADDNVMHPEVDAGLADLNLLTEPQETILLTLLATFPETVRRAAQSREPNLVTTYLQELANGLNKYYKTHKWLVQDPPLRNARLSLLLAARQVLCNGLALIDVSAPEVL